MACKKGPKVYLGYDDEYVTEKHRSLVHYTTNKIGGKPVSRFVQYNNNNKKDYINETSF